MTSVEVIEQPTEKVRFRYESENRFNRSINSQLSTLETIRYPKIRVNGYVGAIYVVISCVQHTKPYRQHPHKIYSASVLKKDNSTRGGVLAVKKTVGKSGEVEFQDIGIMYVKRSSMIESLKERRQKNINPFKTSWDHIAAPKDIDLHTVRLCFQVIGCVNGERTILGVAVTNPIFDKKCIGTLKVTRISHQTATAHGGQVVMIFCDKVRRDDIIVRISEENDDKPDAWKAKCKVVEVHHQFGISFVTPPYSNCTTFERVYCTIQLYRPSDGESSELIPFELVPCEQSEYYRLQFENWWCFFSLDSLKKGGFWIFHVNIFVSSNVVQASNYGGKRKNKKQYLRLWQEICLLMLKD